MLVILQAALFHLELECSHLGLELGLGNDHLPGVVLPVQDFELLLVRQSLEPFAQESELLLNLLLSELAFVLHY